MVERKHDSIRGGISFMSIATGLWIEGTTTGFIMSFIAMLMVMLPFLYWYSRTVGKL